MKKYVIRSVKYFLQLVVLLALIFVLMFATGTAAIPPEMFFSELFGSTRGLVMIVALVLLSAAYPRFGFIRREVRGTLVDDREEVLRAFADCGYEPVSETAGGIVMRPRSPFRRALALGEDVVTVSDDPAGYVILSGLRKVTVRVEYRLRSYIENKQR